MPGWNTYVAAGGGASRPVPYFRGKGVALAYLAFGSEYRFNKLIGMRLEMKGQYNFRATLSDEFGPFEQAGPARPAAEHRRPLPVRRQRAARRS